MDNQSDNDVQLGVSDELVVGLRKALGSCSVNFLFGAGVNGKAFPYFAQFKKTIDAMNERGLDGSNIETALANCADGQIRQEVLNAFVDEYNSHNNYRLYDKSLLNLRRMLVGFASVVGRAENRHPETRRLNVFTLNYDRIVEEILEDSGLFSYTLTQDKAKGRLPFDIVGYNTSTHAFVPTFCVYKLHGSVDTSRTLSANNIVFPGQDKLGSILSHFYETLFAMKGELLKRNSALFVIGYSWADDHVNGIISDAIAGGLTVYWLQYRSEDKLPKQVAGNVIVVPPTDNENPVDATKTLADLLERAGQL